MEDMFQGSGRKVDIDDVMLNGIGFFAGYCVATKFSSPLKEMISQSSIQVTSLRKKT